MTNFNTANQTFRQLLGNGLIYRVPPFQRDYSWTEEEWDDLWQDMLALFEIDGELSHYMGYLVLQSSDHKRFDIIDGQQRLTTLSLMILSALGHMKDLSSQGLDAENNTKRRENLQNSYIGYVDPVSLVPKSKLDLNRHSNSFYQTYLVPLEQLPQRNLNISEQQLKKSFNWFKVKIKTYAGHNSDSGQNLAAFVDTVVGKLFFTVITVTDELNAFKVFETLNARGVRLSSTDLLKNHLFSVINSQAVSHEAELRSLEGLWERIVDLLGNESFVEYLRVYWNSQYKLVRKADLFKTIRRKVDKREMAFGLLRDLDKSAEIYADLLDPYSQRWSQEEKKILHHLSLFNVRQPLAFLLACFHKFAAHDRPLLSRLLKVVSIISFRYNVICNYQTHDQERVFNDAAWKVSQGKLDNFASILHSLKAIYPTDKEFKASFIEKEFKTTNTRNKKIARYILFEIERQLSGKEFEIESALYSLEHILPENPSDDWSYMDAVTQERLIYRLGNLTPMESKQNRALGNQAYSVKREAYQKSSFKMTQAISDHYDSWDEGKIVLRQQKMADVACSLWKISFR